MSKYHIPHAAHVEEQLITDGKNEKNILVVYTNLNLDPHEEEYCKHSVNDLISGVKDIVSENPRFEEAKIVTPSRSA